VKSSKKRKYRPEEQTDGGIEQGPNEFEFDITTKFNKIKKFKPNLTD